MRPNPQETAYLVTFTEEILNGKIDLLCSAIFSKDDCNIFINIILISEKLDSVPFFLIPYHENILSGTLLKVALFLSLKFLDYVIFFHTAPSHFA